MTNAMRSEPALSAVDPSHPPTGRRSRWTWASVLLLLILSLAGAYVYHAARPADPWAPFLKKADKAAESPFGRQVLRDGSISRDEYAQANNKIVECARAKGVTFNLEDRYGLVIFSSAGSYEADTLNECESGDLATIRSLYEGYYKDPRREGDAVYYRCLKKAGFSVPSTNPSNGGSVDDLFDKLLDTSSPADFPRVESCIYDPTGSSKK
jgi:hypothetical protein